MSNPSPTLGKPNSNDDRHWSGTEYQNQKMSRGPGKISIERNESDNAFFKQGLGSMKRCRPSGKHGS